ncbi:hypothetical protein [Novosphingobium sp. Rr 2-17]|uniref:hypothetical protein n=1 Tax=Novosphingobium sp. Rr 2-17 TaxID=555793 RepID=UPI001ED923BF|nr:hypothetical protein [Novosphingobium sp. Rr 2-17]
MDVALIGTSHTMNGIDGSVVAGELAQLGFREPSGRCATVTNFAIPSYGRNLHYLLVRELLSARKPRAIVLEVLENETRKAHPLFSHVATADDMVEAPRIGNLNYFSDLARLPYRQVVLGVESLAPAQFGLKTRFDPTNYDGSEVDNTHVVNVGGKALTSSLDTAMDPGALGQAAETLNKNKRLNYLPKAFEDYEYAMPRRYVQELLQLADRHGVPVLLLYLPGFGKPARPVDMSLYGVGRPLITVNDILAKRPYWHDVHHLNAQGAQQVSRRLAQLLYAALKNNNSLGQKAKLPSTGETGCNFGIPARIVSARPAQSRVIDSAFAAD